MSDEHTAPIAADSVVQEVVDRYPATIEVLIRRRLNCVGCYIAPFHTLADAAREHALAVDGLVREMNHALETLTEF